jgi:tocopherol O-methyltransferase
MSAYINAQEIVDYYDNCQVDYQLVWHLNSRMCMHYGYWDETTPNLRSALNNMNKKLAEFGGIKQGSTVLDAGCGVGGSSIFLAKTLSCNTRGVTLSDKQITKCTANSIKHNVQAQCTFEKQNYLETNFPDNSFDIVWGIESVCYAYDKYDFLKEAYRVLKPGGRVVIADFYSNNIKRDSPQAELMKNWTDTWAIHEYADVNEFWDKMEKAGFVNRKSHDITQNVIKSIERLYYCFFLGMPLSYLFQGMGFRNSLQTANMWSTYYQYKAYKQGLWKYMFYTAEKPY